jgi:penicillin-binding protein A
VVSSIQDKNGNISHRTSPAILGRAVQPETAHHLLEMLESTTTTGTSRKAFYRQGKPRLPFRVAAKTGTLRGSNPQGINHWFISAHPIEKPRLALAVVVVSDGSYGARASELGRLMIQRFEGISSELPAQSAPKHSKKSKKSKKRKATKRKK